MTDPSASHILSLVREHAEHRHQPAAFDPENPRVAASGAVFGAEDCGRARAFERRLAELTGHRHAVLVDSGSSANLLALSALTSPAVGERRLRPADEVVTIATGFPSAVDSIVQAGLVPVLVDVTLPTYTIDVEALRAAIGPSTRAVIAPHTLGNPFDVGGVTEVCREHGLHLIEDCRDALGSRWNGAHVGTFGDLATLGFSTAHQVMLGDAGAVLTNRTTLGNLAGPSHPAATDMQAAVGRAQLARLDEFVARRRANHAFLRRALEPWAEHLILPAETPGAAAAWFGFALTVRPSAPYARRDLVSFLHARGIESRELASRDLLRRPAGLAHRVPGPLEVTQRIAASSFRIGCYPGLGRAHLEHVADAFAEFHSTAAVTLAA